MAGPGRQHPIELILLRQLAARLTTPIALFDRDGRLIYINPAAEVAFGVDFAAMGEVPLERAFAIARPTDDHGAPMTPDTAPVGKALGEGRPEVGTVSIRDPQGRFHRLRTMTIPIQGQGGALFGAMSLFWTSEDTGGVASPETDPPRSWVKGG
jgi:PAS domain-containing protein